MMTAMNIALAGSRPTTVRNAKPGQYANGTVTAAHATYAHTNRVVVKPNRRRHDARFAFNKRIRRTAADPTNAGRTTCMAGTTS